jgi:hypothetical protein
MQMRRVLLPILFSIPLAGAIIWFALQREIAIPASTIAEKTMTTANVSSLPHSAPTRSAGSQVVEISTYPSNSRFTLTKPRRTPNVSTLPKQFLPEETRLVADGQVNADAVQTILHSAQFDDFVRKMRDEMVASAAATDVGGLYIGAVKNSLADMPELTMGEFACGVALCAGSLEVTGEPSLWEQWMKKFDEDSKAPTYAFIETPVAGDGVTRYRIVFSTDPDSNATTKSF